MKNISIGTITRTALLVLALINNALAIAGKSPLPIENDTIIEVINIGFTTAAALAAWWKNNSFSEAAIEADCFMKNLKQK